MTLTIVLRAAILVGIALVAYALMRKAPAALRHAVLIAALGATLLVPLPLPSLRLPVKTQFAASRAIAAPRIRSVVTAWERGTQVEEKNSRAFELIWLAGAIIVALRVALAWRAALRVRDEAARDGETIIWRGRRVVISDRIATPVTVGRTILVPRGTSEVALLHEAAHIRRGDAFTRVVAQLACAVYWFNPLTWIAARLAMLEQERACDDEVIADGIEPVDYADVLLRAATSRMNGAALAMTGSELASRIRSIVDPRRAHTRITWRGVLVASTISFAALGAMASVTIGSAIYDDPISEELPDVALVTPRSVSPQERALVDEFIALAARPKTWRGNLVAQRARWALSKMRDGEIVAPLREALDDSDWRVRAYAAFSLAVARDNASVPRLIELLGDRVWRMRAMAASALAEIGDPRAAAAMERAVHDHAWQVRMEAVSYLGALHHASFRPLLESMQHDEHMAVRNAAMEALAAY